MHANRRNFLAGAGLATGFGALPLSSVQAVASTPASEPDFGPMTGQALLSRNENPYGPAPSAVRAVNETAKMGCYYADRGLGKLRDMIAERHNVAPEMVVIGRAFPRSACRLTPA